MAVIEFPRASDPRYDWVRAYNELREWHFTHKWSISPRDRLDMIKALQAEISVELIDIPISSPDDWRSRVRSFMGWKS